MSEGISLIPTAAFTALVANDLFDPALFAAAPLDGTLTLVVAGVVVVVARRTKSLLWCAVVGMLGYAALVLRWAF